MKGRDEIDSEAIARIVGVSRSTVSKVIHNYPNISEPTRQKVLKAIEDHGYIPNYPAQLMAGHKTRTLGFFFFAHGSFADDALVNLMISSVIESAAVCGYHILSYIIHKPDDSLEQRRVREVFLQGRIDGGIFVGNRIREPIIEQLALEGAPLAVFDHPLPGKGETDLPDNLAVVNLDDRRTARGSISWLHSLGHRRIMVVNGDLGRNGGRAKHDAYLLALRDHGLDPWPLAYNEDFSSMGGRSAMEKFLASGHELPDAIAAANDSIAFGIIDLMAERGIRVPQDVSIIGTDGHPLAALIQPRLTTWAYDFKAVMRHLVEALKGRIHEAPLDEGARRVEIPIFVEGGTCGPNPSAGV